MALVRHNAAALRARAEAHDLDDLLVRQARITFGAGVGAGEVRSWRESLPALLTDVHDAGLDHVEVLLEHKLPFSPKRVDAILCGVHPTTRRPSYVVVELKQWTNAVSREDGLVDVPQYGRPVLHPVDQVRGYCDYLVDFVPSLAPEHSDVHGIAYLHNAAAAGWKLATYEVDAHGQLFRGDQRGALVGELRRLLDADPESADASRAAADDLLGAAPRPSRPLLSVAADEVRQREQFVLVDEQRVAYRMVEHAVERAHRHNTKTAVIVLGGPGSGKSVLALSLLGDLARKGRSVLHATGSSAFTRTLRKVAGTRSPRTQKLFTYFNSFIGHEPNDLDVVICDEAHRIREYSVNRYTPATVRAKARPQVEELIGVARVPVFLLDEHQVVRPGEMGTEAEIRAAAERAGCRVEVVRLAGQYRCGGSEFYEEWVRRLLGLDPRPPVRWSELTDPADEHYRVAALPSPTALESWLLGQVGDSADTARLSAGYCWRWSDPAPDDGVGKRLADDVVVGEWSRPWNAKPGTRVPDAPESHFWASDPRGFGQVGCIYTAQGFEYDWSGVIVGPDLVRRGDRWVADSRTSFDGAVKRAGQDEFPALVRNTYKVLLTRGMKGTAVFSTDPETQEFLESVCR